MGLALELDEGGAAGVLGVDGIHHRLGAAGRDDIVIRAVVGPDLGFDVPGLFRIADRADDESPREERWFVDQHVVNHVSAHRNAGGAIPELTDSGQ